MAEKATTIYLKDYKAPSFEIQSLQLCFKLHEEGASVIAEQKIRRTGDELDLLLHGEELELRSISIDGEPLAEDRYEVTEETLKILGVADEFQLVIETWIKPQENKRLEGLYKSSSMFCTQCEAEGFRRITYYLDRPDVMTEFTTRIEADKSKYPILLSNGNPIESGDLSDGRHFVTWHDPFLKPCYLFALVAGDLHCLKDSFTTCSGREIDLRIYVDHKNADKCDYAIDCLKRSMRWDEDVYGREYDLDIFMIVAVDDFNMGAMENKGLNIFNSSCVLAKPDATTDSSYERIEAIVAHEYFHNWSGNRVTCRDWFQLSLKEGFTVFRDAEFSADMNSRTVKRIDDVNLLRTAQFAEDAGPMSHPVRPASYMEISNFYTLTVYEKGAEVVRMLHTLLGAELFRKGSDLYFDRHDGQAVTTEDFVAAMESVSDRDLAQFKRWYDQGGTPCVDVESKYDAANKAFSLTFKQTCPATPGQNEKKAFHIPIKLALLDTNGAELPLSVALDECEFTYELTSEAETLVFEGLDAEPVPSLLRGFSAPIKLDYDYSDDQLLFLMAHDGDGFNRWDASQTLSIRILQNLIADYQGGRSLALPSSYVEAYRSILQDKMLDKAMVCKMLMLPAESYLVQLSERADIEAIHHAREFVRAELSRQLSIELNEVYRDNLSQDNLSQDNLSQGNLNQNSELDLSFAGMSQRALKNACLSLLAAGARSEPQTNSATQLVETAQAQFSSATNMTDLHAALSVLVNAASAEDAEKALEAFKGRWSDDAQVMELWFSVQSSSAAYMNLERLKKLMDSPLFDITNPNKVRSVIGVFCNQNLINFHQASGQGYEFLADKVIELDNLNPQIASRLLTPLTRWKKFDLARQEKMTAALKRIHVKDNLSKDVREIVEKSLV